MLIFYFLGAQHDKLPPVIVNYRNGTIDYQGRHHEIDFVLSPYYGTANLSFTAAQNTLKLDYKKTILHFERNDTKTSGLDALAVRPAQVGFPQFVDADPEMPIPSTQLPHLCLDTEGIISNADGTSVFLQILCNQ